MSKRSAPSSCPTTGTSSTWCGSACSRPSTSSSDRKGTTDCAPPEPLPRTPLASPPRSGRRPGRGPDRSGPHRRAVRRVLARLGARGRLGGPDQAGPRAVPGGLLLLPRRQRPGREDPRRQPARPVAGRRRCRRGRLPGRHGPDACHTARPADPAEGGHLHRRGDRRPRGVRRLPRPGPGHPEPPRLQPRGTHRRAAPGGDRPRWPDLPDQLHRLSQRPGRRWRDAARRLRAEDPGRAGQVRLRGDADRAPGHGQLLQRQPDARREARHHRLPAVPPGQPRVRRLRHGRARPGQRGPVRVAGRHRLAGRRGDLDRRAHRSLHQGEGMSAHDNLPEPVAGDHAPAVQEEPITNPGLPAHEWRPTDVDPRAEKRAERQVAGLFGLATLGAIAFIVSYFVFGIGDNPDTIDNLGASNLALGLCLAVTLLGMGTGMIQWARKLMSDHEIVEMRHTASSPQEDREATVGILQTGLEESGLGRRPLIRNSLLAAGGLLGLLPLVMLRDLGPLPGDTLDHTIWDLDTWTPEMKLWWEGQDRTLQRVVRDVVGTPIKATELEIGDLVNAEPEVLFAVDEETKRPIVDGTQLLVDKSKAAVILHRMLPGDIVSAQTRNWSVNGIVCYSKICTHVGCPISLNERTTHHLLCPCHQSTFDLADSGRVLFGPAARALPQLELLVDEEGYLAAKHDFDEPVGPSFWERG